MASHDPEDPMDIASTYVYIQGVCESVVDGTSEELLNLFEVLTSENHAMMQLHNWLARKKELEVLLRPACDRLLAKMAALAMTMEPSGPDPSHHFFSQVFSILRRADHLALLDRHNRAIAQILKRFSNMVMAGSEPLPQTGNIIEHASINRMTIETECAGLIAEIEALLAINREIKALWIRGPLRPAGEDAAREAEMDRQALNVARLSDRARALRDKFIDGPNAAAAGGGTSHEE